MPTSVPNPIHINAKDDKDSGDLEFGGFNCFNFCHHCSAKDVDLLELPEDDRATSIGGMIGLICNPCDKKPLLTR